MNAEKNTKAEQMRIDGRDFNVEETWIFIHTSLVSSTFVMIIAVQKSFTSYTLIFNKYTFNEQILNSFSTKPDNRVLYRFTKKISLTVCIVKCSKAEESQ